MKTVWMDYGLTQLRTETDNRLIALYYVMTNQELSLAGVSAEEPQTRTVLSKVLRQAGQDAPLSCTDAARQLDKSGQPMALLAIGTTELLEQMQDCTRLSQVVLAGCQEFLAERVLDLSLPTVALFHDNQIARITVGSAQQQESCCCETPAEQAPDFADLGLTAALYLAHPEWFTVMHRDGSAASYPFASHITEAMEAHVSRNLPQLRMQEENCPCQGAYLDKLVKPAVLVILSGGPSHGFQILQQLEQRNLLGGETLDAAGLYRMLKRMQSAGYLVSRWDTGQAHAKRVFQITPLGRACLANWAPTLEAYREYVDNMAKQIRAVL